ncbi:hypothetical protein NC652_014807 [Populus alba x Populus x berolinensis]|nr:hypothetical protein NC652_014807 [Populus alba x Populus x berolinensis]
MPESTNPSISRRRALSNAVKLIKYIEGRWYGSIALRVETWFEELECFFSASSFYSLFAFSVDLDSPCNT